MLTQFEIYQNAAVSLVVLGVNSGTARTQFEPDPPAIPLEGTASLHIQHFAASVRSTIIPGSALPRGYTKGMLRTQMLPYDTGSTGVYGFGLFCLGNQPDTSSGTGNCYMLGFDNQNFSYSMWLSKSKNSGTILAPPQRFSGVAYGWASVGTFTLSLSWRASGTAVTLIAQRGTLPDFSDLLTVFSHVDSTSAFTGTASSEGFWAETTTAPGLQVFFDRSRWQQNT